MACPCSGPWPPAPLIWGTEGPLQVGSTPWQVRPFEPAFATAGTVYAMTPYSPALVAAVSPVMQGPVSRVADVAPMAAAAAAVATVASLDGPRCGACCGKSYSPLPPNAVQAWQSVLGCGGRCTTCQYRSF